MYKGALRSLIAPLVAMSLAASAGLALAQQDNQNPNQNNNQNNQNTDQDRNRNRHRDRDHDRNRNDRQNGSANYQSDMAHYTYGDMGPSMGRVKVAQVFVDKDFRQKDLVAVLPLLQDLRDARQACDAKHDVIYTNLILSRGDNAKLSADSEWRDCEKALSDRQHAIWTTISDKIGSDKADALRMLVEPRSEDTSRMAYTDSHIERITSMIQDLDRMAAARIAANGGTPADQNGVRQASVETTTTVTTTTTPGIPIYVTTPAVITERDLVKVVEDRIVANEIGNSDYLVMMPMDRDLNSTDITFLREGKMMVW